MCSGRMHEVIIQGNNTYQSGQSYIVRVAKMGILITHNTKHICKTLITEKQYLREQIVKGTAWLEDIITESNSIEPNRVVTPHAAGTLVNAYHSGMEENMILDQQAKGAGAGTNRMDSEQDHNEGYVATKTEIMKCSKKDRSNKIRIWSENISHKSGRL